MIDMAEQLNGSLEFWLVPNGAFDGTQLLSNVALRIVDGKIVELCAAADLPCATTVRFHRDFSTCR
jgi:hypothetical protein